MNMPFSNTPKTPGVFVEKRIVDSRVDQAINDGDMLALRALSKQGVSLGGVNPLGRLPLSNAIAQDRLEMAAFLALEMGCDANERPTPHERSAVEWAVYMHDVKALAMLAPVADWRQVDHRNMGLCAQAALDNCVLAVEYLAQKTQPLSANAAGLDPMGVAVSAGALKIVDILAAWAWRQPDGEPNRAKRDEWLALAGAIAEKRPKEMPVFAALLEAQAIRQAMGAGPPSSGNAADCAPRAGLAGKRL